MKERTWSSVFLSQARTSTHLYMYKNIISTPFCHNACLEFYSFRSYCGKTRKSLLLLRCAPKDSQMFWQVWRCCLEASDSLHRSAGQPFCRQFERQPSNKDSPTVAACSDQASARLLQAMKSLQPRVYLWSFVGFLHMPGRSSWSPRWKRGNTRMCAGPDVHLARL